MIGFIRTLVIALGVSHGVAFAHIDGHDLGPTDVPGMVDLQPNSLARMNGVLKNFHHPAKRTFTLLLGPKLIELKAFYLEKRRHDAVSAESLGSHPLTELGSYFDLFARSSQFGGKLVGESELAYSTLGWSSYPDEQPVMTRLGLNGNWDKAGYGMSFRSFGSGFVSTAGAKVDHARNETQLWAEYDFGLFRMRGGTGETREINALSNLLTLTRSAGTSLQFSKADWSASLTSTYSIVDQEDAVSRKLAGLNNDLIFVFRPAAFLTIEPKLRFRKEWGELAGSETDTPSAALSLSCTPAQSFRLVGQASYARGVGDDPLKNATTIHTAASLNWHIGRSFLGEQSLAVQLDYRSESRLHVPESSQSNMTGMIQLKIAGFRF